MAYYESLRYSVGASLYSIAKFRAELATRAEILLENWSRVRSRYKQNFSYPHLQHRIEGIVDHRLVVYWRELLNDVFRNRVQPRACAASQDDSTSIVHLYHSRPSLAYSSRFSDIHFS